MVPATAGRADGTLGRLRHRPANAVGASWPRLCRQGGVEKTTNLSIIADGAKWIWDQAARRFTMKLRVFFLEDNTSFDAVLTAFAHLLTCSS
jgi:hypothetical protein